MNDQQPVTEETGKTWLFNKARELPLLTAEEERSIDERKWASRDQLLHLMLEDPRSRAFVTQWVGNLLENPPCLERFAQKEHYYTLRREQAELVQSDAAREQMLKLQRQLRSWEKQKDPGSKAEALLASLNLSAVLVAGMAALLLSENDHREMAAALRYWRQFWPESRKQQPPMSPVNHLRALSRTLLKYQHARETLVQHNVRLVFAVAAKQQSDAVPYQDRVQSGVVGLIRAAEKYDHRKGFRFSTYAYGWINQSMRRSLDDQRGIVRYPADVNEQLSRAYRARAAMLGATGREPGDRELAEQLDLTPEALQKLQQLSNWSVSLDSTWEDEEGLTLAEKLPGETFTTPGAEGEKDSLNRCLRRGLKRLTPQEQRVVMLRWGLNDEAPLTRRQMADQMSVSAERVRQLEVSALDKLRGDRDVRSAYRAEEMSE
ncbi:MAG: RNA polymerase sigma factor RpoD/SigA [Pseudomonadota bacterium]